MNLLYLNFPEIKNNVIFIPVYLSPSCHMLMEMLKQCCLIPKAEIFEGGHVTLASFPERLLR